MLKPSVLIVESFSDIAQLETAIAKACGCLPDTAESGEEAVALLRQKTYEVMLIGSPIDVGENQLMLDLLRHEFRQYARRAIVLTTFVHVGPIASLAARAGVFAVLAKPFDLEVLAQIIWSCIGNNGASGPTKWIGMPSFDAELAGAMASSSN